MVPGQQAQALLEHVTGDAGDGDQIDAQVAKVAAGEVNVISALADDAAWQDIKTKATAPLN